MTSFSRLALSPSRPWQLLAALLILFGLTGRCRSFDFDGQSHGGGHCSRQQSKEALGIIERLVLPIYERRSVQMPSGCIFQPKPSRYHDNEKRTFANSASNWQCGYCGKSFYRETSLWAHYERRHPETVANGTVCLADTCPLLRCHVQTRPDSFDYWRQALCKESSMLPLMEKCMLALDSCAPHGQEGVAVKDELAESVCSFLTCDNYFTAHSSFIPRALTSQVWKVAVLVLALYAYYIFVCMHMCDLLGVPRDSRHYYTHKRR